MFGALSQVTVSVSTSSDGEPAGVSPPGPDRVALVGARQERRAHAVPGQPGMSTRIRAGAVVNPGIPAANADRAPVNRLIRAEMSTDATGGYPGSATKHPRQPAGVPVGGQFATASDQTGS